MRHNSLCQIILVATLAALSSCSSNAIIDEQVDMPDGIWHIDSLASFDFRVDDISTAYTVDYNVRFAIDYPHYNLFVRYYLEDSTGTILTTAQQELLLFDKKTGVPFGEGLGDLYDRNIRILEAQQFDYQGQYTLKIKQFMRMDNLPGILAFGVAIAPVEK